MVKRCLFFCLCTFLVLGTSFSPISERMLNSHREEPQKRTCFGVLKKLSLMVLDKSALITVATLGAWAGSEYAGVQSQAPLVGLSIYLDYDSVLNHLNSEERAELEAKKKNPARIAEILNNHLFRKTGEAGEMFPYLHPLMASDYFGETPPDTNVCRHKALIMKAIMEHLGISVKLVTGTIKSDDGFSGSHVWIYLPEINKVADPMNNALVSPQDYERIFQAQTNYGLMHFAKPIGVLAR